jgi:hypothetical protein
MLRESQTAVVARGMGKCAIVGCKELEIDFEHRRFVVDGTTVEEGDWITLDGATGRVFPGDLPTVPSEVVREGRILEQHAALGVVLVGAQREVRARHERGLSVDHNALGVHVESGIRDEGARVVEDAGPHR